MKKYIFAGILLCMMALCSCMQVETPPAGDEAAMKTEAGREAYIAEKLYEGAEILSEVKNEETGFIVTEFLAGDLHSFVFFRPTEKGYAYNGEAEHTMDGLITEAYAPLGDGMYYVFLRHSEDIEYLDVTRIDGETNEAVQNGIVAFEDSDLALMLQDDEIHHWRMRIVAYDKDGQEYVLQDGEAPEVDLIEELEKERERRFVRKVISFAVIFVAANVIAEIRRKK